MSPHESAIRTQSNEAGTQTRGTALSQPASHWLPWLLFGLACACAALDLLFLALTWATPVPDMWGFRGQEVVLALAFGCLGQLLARRRPENRIGWLFLAAGLVGALDGLGMEYAAYALLTRHGTLPGGVFAGWVASWLWTVYIGFMMYTLLLYPTGRLPSERWRPIPWVLAGSVVLWIVEFMLRPGPLWFASYLVNPVAIPGSDTVLRLFGILSGIGLGITILGVIVGMIQRLRRAVGIERQQLKLFAYLTALISAIGLINSTLGLLLGIPNNSGPKAYQFLTAAGLIAIPLAVGVAILRYRLYEIDRVINRTLVYGTLTAAVVVTYILIVGLLGSLLNSDVNLAAAMVTAALTVLFFQPLRARLQRSFNRTLLSAVELPSPPEAIEESHASYVIALSRWLPWLLFGLTCALAALDLIFLALDWSAPMAVSAYSRWFVALYALIYGAIGQYLARKRAHNAIGWLFLLFALIAGALGFGAEYSTYALVVRPGALPGGTVAAWLISWLFVGLIGTATYVVFLFPTGHLPSARWRPVVWVAAAVFASAMLFYMLRPGPLRVAPYVDNPFGMPSSDALLGIVNLVTFTALALCQLAAAASVLVRFRHAGGIERQQLKWFAYTAGILMVVGLLQAVPATFNVAVPDWWNVFNILLPVTIVALPFSVALAILRYRLYDIDRVINHTLVYGGLTAGVVALYVVLVGALGALSQTSGNLLISLLATGLIAFLFQPLRERLQRGVNRLMYGERDEPYALIARLGQSLETAFAPDTLLDTLVRTIAQALKLPYVAIETGGVAGVEIAAAYGQAPSPAQRIPLTYQGETVGYLLVTPRAANEPLNPADLNLLRIIAQQAGMAVHAVQLTADLQRSRERLVVAREEERRRIRRDLHDGLGPVLASLAMQADSAREWTRADPDKSEAALAEITQKAQDALQDIRRLVYDLRPPALDELGLVGALRQTAANSPNGLHIEIDAPALLPPLSAAVEVAAYRIAQETLNNVARHAHARNCTVTVSVQDELRLEIGDDGVGLPEGVRTGVGLISMRERAAELGGSCVVECPPGGGTRVFARLPLAQV